MKLYPALDLREGATVQLVGGDLNREEVHEPEPLKVAAKWAQKGASALHVVDLDAAFETGNNLWIVDRLLNEIFLPIQLGGGVRHLVDIQRRLDMGVGRVIVGTQGIKEPLWFQTAAELFPGKLMLAIDARGDEVTVSGWQQASGVSLSDVIDRVDNLPLAGLLYTNVDVEGRLQGIDRAAVEAVVTRTQHRVVASGGISAMDDLDILKDVGCDAAVLGMSIYTGRIDLKQAIERIEGREVVEGRHVWIPKPAVQWGGIPEGAPPSRILRVPGDEDEDADEEWMLEAEGDGDPPVRDYQPPGAGTWGRGREKQRQRQEEDEDA